MKDPNDKRTRDLLAPPPSPGARRQEAYRQRQRKAGRRQVTVWIRKDDWQAGYEAGAAGLPSTLPEGVDGLSWFSGFIEGKAAREKAAREVAS